ncbi:MAG TPA: hypothetical protein VE907_15975 [Gammaproteobacteria bacterium]|nr:hypothetical protein [Gammaproteobacteria bacterium]
MRSSLAAVIAALVASGPCAAEAPVAVPPDQPVAGLTQAAWSQAWWQWAASFDRRDSPIADETGERCASRQQGDVWFLAGTYGTARTIRKCVVPRGKFLFFPLINYVVMPRDDRANCFAFIAEAARITDAVSYLIVDLDGRRLEHPEAYRQATQCFDVGSLARPTARIYPSAANGYYVMLRPLEPGTHELNFGGVLPSMRQAVTYALVVE